jgi:ABC-type nickel/cobalt efflux system permease component RcnA
MRRWLILGFLAVLLAFAHPPERAAAHPLGNFTVNQYSRLEVDRERIHLRYIVDMAEIPAFQERQAIDTDGDGQVSTAEGDAYLARQAPALVAGLQLTVGGAPAALRPARQALTFPPGQGGLVTLRLELDLEAPIISASQPLAIAYRDTNFAERIGWREIVVRPGDGVVLHDSTVPTHDQSDELRTYPQDMLASPLDVREARLSATISGASSGDTPPTNSAAQPLPSRANDAFAALIATHELTPPMIALALLLALLLGAGHALTPGHGKTIVAAYLVGARGTPRHAIFLGLTTTITHTLGVFLLGFVTLALSAYLLPEQLYPWLEFLSGALVAGIGLLLFRSRLVGLLRARQSRSRSHGPDRTTTGEECADLHDHEGGHNHSHSHGHLPTHAHRHGHSHTHTHDHHHDHGHTHDHGHGHSHDHDHALVDWVVAKTQRAAPQPQSAVTWRSLLALGVSGGLLPCPSALVVLLSAIALHRLAFGMLLIVAFSLGLAGMLTGIGLLLVAARHLFERFPTDGRLLRVLPVASAAVVTLAGLAITARALVQAGVVRI